MRDALFVTLSIALALAGRVVADQASPGLPSVSFRVVLLAYTIMLLRFALPWPDLASRVACVLLLASLAPLPAPPRQQLQLLHACTEALQSDTIQRPAKGACMTSLDSCCHAGSEGCGGRVVDGGCLCCLLLSPRRRQA